MYIESIFCTSDLFVQMFLVGRKSQLRRKKKNSNLVVRRAEGSDVGHSFLVRLDRRRFGRRVRVCQWYINVRFFFCFTSSVQITTLPITRINYKLKSERNLGKREKDGWMDDEGQSHLLNQIIHGVGDVMTMLWARVVGPQQCCRGPRKREEEEECKFSITGWYRAWQCHSGSRLKKRVIRKDFSRIIRECVCSLKFFLYLSLFST